MTAPQWVTGCGYKTLQTLSFLLRPLRRWLGSTILIRLVYAKTQSVFQAYQWHMCWTCLWKKHKKLELYCLGGICHLRRHKREELQHCSCNGALKCVGYCEEYQLDIQALWVWMWKGSHLRSVKNRHGGRASASFYKVSWKRHHTHKASCVWRKEQIDKRRHWLWCKCFISLLFRWCNALWQRHAGCE